MLLRLGYFVGCDVLTSLIILYNKLTRTRLDPSRPGQTQLGPTRPHRDTLRRFISRKVLETCNFGTILIHVLNTFYQNLESISFTVWKICAFMQQFEKKSFYKKNLFFFLLKKLSRKNYLNFRLNGKFQILMVSWNQNLREIRVLSEFHGFMEQIWFIFI